MNDARQNWQVNFLESASPNMNWAIAHDNYLLVIITVITLFVLALLVYTLYKFSAKRNPNPSKTTHNTLIEIIWFAVPTLIVIAIAIPSVKLTYRLDHIPAEEKIGRSDLTVKVIGHQFFWEYSYPEFNNYTFESNLIPEDKLQAGQLRLLEVDNRLVLPVDTNIKFQIVGDPLGVIHAFAVPQLGVKIDAVPGKLNETWTRINKEGIYRGQCSELCGAGHAYMPIVVEAVSKVEFQRRIKLLAGIKDEITKE
jgi:cytochrome c oxidase subunit II